ncbi:MAG TPA: exodeoxyribonuclease VII small subunit [Candidatus Binataceae bacterium]|jgi:exodeoxyribonuclease VII small subunit
MAGAEKKFEEELAELSAIVAKIDSGELSLEESIACFERGVAMVKSLNQMLDDAEKRVEVLIKGAQGELRTTPLRVEPENPDHGGGNGHDDDDEEVPS